MEVLNGGDGQVSKNLWPYNVSLFQPDCFNLTTNRAASPCQGFFFKCLYIIALCFNFHQCLALILFQQEIIKHLFPTGYDGMFNLLSVQLGYILPVTIFACLLQFVKDLQTLDLDETKISEIWQ